MGEGERKGGGKRSEIKEEGGREGREGREGGGEDRGRQLKCST